jgi:hypothetical protein
VYVYTFCQYVVISVPSVGCTEVISVPGIRTASAGGLVCEIKAFVLTTPLKMSPDSSAWLFTLIVLLDFCSEINLESSNQ